MTAAPLSQFRLDGRVAMITGGGNGIGLATAELFAASGARVIIADREADAAAAAAEAIGPMARPVTLDVSDEAAVDRAMAEIDSHEARLDILVNNAGIALRRPTVDLPVADWDKVLAVNLTGVFLCARAAARRMIAQGGGAIVNTASIMGLSGGGLYPNISYQATKGAVVNVTRALAVEWAKAGIRVNAVAPTWVRTRFIAALAAQPDLMAEIERVTPLGRLAEPNEVAAAILFLASPAAAMITGHTLPVDGGFLAQ